MLVQTCTSRGEAMKSFICALVLSSAVGCDSCYVVPPGPVSSSAAVSTDAAPTSPASSVSVVQPGDASSALSPKVVANRRILIIGDSEACVVSSQVKNAKLPTDTVDVDCKGGTVVQYWGTGGHFRAALARHPKPDVVLIFLGTNHHGQKVTPPVAPILDLVRDNGLQCVWVGNTAVDGKRWAINGLIHDAVQPTCSYFDTEAAGIQLTDGVHPYGAAALKWLQAIWPTIPMKYEETHER